ncbi:hypothetical protein JCM10908_004747 [Rhodotorula pacifica]|uniref:uncharacterized protein n=1 Tax=Rhodotorula pacifica TaxID=1495444 RepID=UPI003179823A
MAPNWAQIREDKHAEQRRDIAEGVRLAEQAAPSLSKDLALAIRSADAGTIVDNIAAKEPGWTAVNVLRVYVEAAAKEHARSNVLTEILFSSAFKRAQELDAEFEKTGKIVGPLHGVPVSLKDQIDVEGVDTTMGFTHKQRQPMSADATLVRLIRQAGGIPFVKSAIPQTMLSFECSTPLFGVAKNPYDPRRTPGGSSGGEGALLGSDASVIGIGSDIGGSLRIPSHFSGCFALKPCAGRFSSEGCQHCNPGFEGVRSSMGPMGRSVADVERMARVAFDATPELAATQTNLLPIKYRDVKLPDRPLRFGYFTHDGFVAASPACERAVLETVEALRKAGHECIDFTPPSTAEAMMYFVAVSSAGKHEILMSSLKGDPTESFLYLTTQAAKLPAPIRWLLEWFAGSYMGDAQAAKIVAANGGKTVNELQTWMHRRDLYVKAARKLMWEELKFDAVICPTQATPALKHGETNQLSVLSLRTIHWNVIDSSVGQLPVTFVDAEKDAPSEEWEARRRAAGGSPLIEPRVYGPKGIYNAKEMAGLPVGVQVVGRQWDDERVIELMKVVDKALGPRGFGPGEFAKRQQAAEKVY